LETYDQDTSGSSAVEARSNGNNLDRTIQVYWQNRLVPESTLSQLPFFPSTNANSSASKFELAKSWRGRIGGFLFFDWSFRHISNNKLKILVDPNLNTWLNTSEVKSKTIMTPKNAQAEFLK
jgi:hypothetical protein